MRKLLGIDLGTTNACVAVMEGATPRVIPNAEGARTTPTVVAFTSKGETLVGRVARRQALTNPQNTSFGFLRLLGRPFDAPETQAARKMLPYEIVAGGDGLVRIGTEERLVSPTELAAIVLGKLKADAEDHLGEPVEDVILTVPNSWTERERRLLVHAASSAGLRVIRTLSASSAAALAYGLAHRYRGIVAVYDFGGGSFDVSIAEFQDGIYQVLACGGDPSVGGEDFDRLIVQELIDEFSRRERLDLTRDRMALQRLNEAAEKAKIELSYQVEVEVALPYISADASGPKHLKTLLSRTRLEELMAPGLERTVEVCRRALADAGLAPSEVETVIPVGGQCRAPLVQQTIARIFGREPRRDMNPDEAAALGAAQIGALQGDVTGVVLLDVTPHAIGIETTDGNFLTLVERSTNVPTRTSRLCDLVANQDGVVVLRLVQGEARHSILGEWRLTDVAWRPRTSVVLEIAVEVGFGGFVELTARDPAGGRSATLTAPGSRTSEPVRLQDLPPQPEVPRERPQGPERVRAQLTGLIVSTRKTLELLYLRLTAEERNEGLLALQAADEAAEGSPEQMDAAILRLEAAAESLGQAMLRS